MASAIARNQIATAALAASVAAGTLGTVAAYQTVQQGHRIDAQGIATADLRDRLQSATDAVATLRANIADLNTADAAAIKALSKRITTSARDIGLLGDQVDALPPSPDTTALADHVSQLAGETAAAAEEAKVALSAARNAKDPEARAAAQAASVAATDAGTKAEAARIAAQAAHDKYAPMVYIYPDGGPYNLRRIVVEVDGDYRVTLTATGEGFIAASLQGNVVPLGTTVLHLSNIDTYLSVDAEGGPYTGVSVTLQLVRA